MYLDPFHHANGAFISIAPEQASRFAKEMAGDFNPIHDPDSRRFCVPGDLLFALILARHGLSPAMEFVFKGMVGRDVLLDFTPTAADAFELCGEQGKAFVSIHRRGPVSQDPALIESLTRHYVAFSGLNFPHTIQPLLAEQNVMLNPARPTVIYERMRFALDNLDFHTPRLQPAQAELKVDGKRGEVSLNFTITAAGKTVGQGYKRLLVSGLIPYDSAVAAALVADYEALKRHYKA
ncbi:MAG: DUF3581 family protein [Thiothrix sp.]|nr:DUF3581 family protein [Thiothrix sp.]HPQ96711.1 DUF3581 family protein [Thiolinea sp.]